LKPTLGAYSPQKSVRSLAIASSTAKSALFLLFHCFRANSSYATHYRCQ